LYEQNEKKLQMRMRMSGELTSCHRHGLVVEARLNASNVEEGEGNELKRRVRVMIYDFVLLLTL
jgi:hypothetical protein